MIWSSSNIDRSSYRLRIICSLFNEKYTNTLLADSCSSLSFTELRVASTNNQGSGCFRNTFIISRRSVYENCDGIRFRCILRGETYHFEIVANESARGIQEASCNKKFPCINGILTAENEAQAFERSVNKGRSFAKTLIYMIDISKSLEKELKE